MSACWVTLVSSVTRTRVLVMQGQDEVLHEAAGKRLLEGLSMWLDQRICVVLSAAERDLDSFRLDLVDELGAGARSVFYAVEPVPREALHRPRRLRGAGNFGDLRQLWLWASSEGAQ